VSDESSDDDDDSEGESVVSEDDDDSDEEASLGTDEEEGLDWDELEHRAAKYTTHPCNWLQLASLLICLHILCSPSLLSTLYSSSLAPCSFVWICTGDGCSVQIYCSIRWEGVILEKVILGF
jgi:hypothetical protein